MGQITLHSVAADFHRLAVGANQKKDCSDVLSKLFPRTCEQLTSGRFRWIRYRATSHTLEVIVGRGTGSDRRKPPTNDVCQTFDGELPL